MPQSDNNENQEMQLAEWGTRPCEIIMKTGIWNQQMEDKPKRDNNENQEMQLADGGQATQR